MNKISLTAALFSCNGTTPVTLIVFMEAPNTQDWNNYWLGRASHESGNALVEVGIEQEHTLKTFWRNTFQNRDKSTIIVDLACGAGSVLEHAFALDFKNLTGLDISEAALGVMKSKIPIAKAVCSSLFPIRLKDNSVDLIVSQFGIEYTTTELHDTFREVERVLRSNGEIVIIAHHRDGLIYQDCLQSLEQIASVEESGFIATSKEIVSALYGDTRLTQKEFKNLMLELNEAANTVMILIRHMNQKNSHLAQFISHLLESSHKLIMKHKTYSRIEALQWISGMQAELLAYKGRMTSMTNAALSRQNVSELKECFTSSESSLRIDLFENFEFPSRTKPAAWLIKGVKH